jgi:acyl carrier protein
MGMPLEEFLVELAEILDVDEVSAAAVLVDLPEWDSLSILSVVALADEKFQAIVSADEIRRVDTAQALFEFLRSKQGTPS